MPWQSRELAPPLIEHYVCCGVGPTLEPAAAGDTVDSGWHQLRYKPVVLTEFSVAAAVGGHESPSQAAVTAFCLPTAVQLSRRAQSPHFGSFVLTQGDGSRLYGHCLTTYVRLAPEVRVQHLAATTDAEAEATASTLEALDSGTAWYGPRCLCLLSRSHHPLAFKACLLALQRMVHQSTTAGLPLPVETCLTHLVLNVPRPVPGGPTIRFRLGNGAPPLHVGCAPPDALPSTEYSMGLLLRRLAPSVLVNVFRAALLEQQVVVVSDDEEVRLAACELLLLLLHPFSWVQIYVPTVPDDLLSLLQNPFPCLLGLRTHQARWLPNPRPEHMAVLDLEAGTLAMPSAPLPPFPPREEIHLLDVLGTQRRHLIATDATPHVLGTQRRHLIATDATPAAATAAAAAVGTGAGTDTGAGAGTGAGTGTGAAAGKATATSTATARGPAASIASCAAGAAGTAGAVDAAGAHTGQAGCGHDATAAAAAGAPLCATSGPAGPAAVNVAANTGASMGGGEAAPAMAAPLDADVLEAVLEGDGSTPADAFGLDLLLPPPADAATVRAAVAPAAMLEARTRGAFLRAIVSMLRDLHRFVPEATATAATAAAAAASAPGTDTAAVLADAPPEANGVAAAGTAVPGLAAPAAEDDVEGQLSRFLAAQPPSSRPFLTDLLRTQLFLCFLEPSEAFLAASDSGGSRGGGDGSGGAAEGGRGGRCFQLVRDGFLQRELRHAAARERQHGSDPLPASVSLMEAADAASAGSRAAAAAADGARVQGLTANGEAS